MRLTIPIFMEIALVVLVGFVDMLILLSCDDKAGLRSGVGRGVCQGKIAALPVSYGCQFWQVVRHLPGLVPNFLLKMWLRTTDEEKPHILAIWPTG